MTIDLTGIAASVIAGIFGIVGPLFLYWLTQHLKDAEARATVSAAVGNALGALQQAAQDAVVAVHPHVAVPGVSAALAPGVAYVLAQAGPEAARLGITPAEIEAKVAAQVGKANIAANLAVAASPQPTPAPLDPVPATAPITLRNPLA